MKDGGDWFVNLAAEVKSNPFSFRSDPSIVTDLRDEQVNLAEDHDQKWWDDWWATNGDEADDDGVSPPPFVPTRTIPTGPVFVGGEISTDWSVFLQDLAASGDETYSQQARFVVLGWLTASRADRYLPEGVDEVKASLYALADILADSDEGDEAPAEAVRVYTLASLVCKGAGLQEAAGKWRELADTFRDDDNGK